MSKCFKLINIGRNKICRDVIVKSDSQLLKEVSKHLGSRDISLIPTNSGFAVIAGFRQVGTIEEIIGQQISLDVLLK